MHFPPPNLQRPGRMKGKEIGQGRKTAQERGRVEMMVVAEMARTIFFAVGRSGKNLQLWAGLNPWEMKN